MDPEYSRLVEEAASIAISGRWDRINERIKLLAGNPGIGNEWWIQVFSRLCYQVFSEYLAIKRSHEENANDNTSLLAWRARNLLELSVWCIYVSKRRENARRFFEDAGRDTKGLLGAFQRWGTTTFQEQGWLDNIESARQRISQDATTVGIASIDGPYKRVDDASTEIGISEHFKVSYRMCSKFAHPTAIRILSDHDEANIVVLNDLFYSHGCLCFLGAFNALETQLLNAPFTFK